MTQPVRRSILAALLCLAGAGCRGAEAVDESPLEREAIGHLVEYLKIDTSNPPGNETAAAKYLAAILAREGIASELVGSRPDRQSVIARLESAGDEPALLLLHHLDVVPADPSEWSVPPFSGERKSGYIWGRGAIDAKSLGIAHLMAFLELKRSGVALRRDVVLLGVADEEAGGLAGMGELIENRPDLFANIGFVLNEGGGAETIVDYVSFWGIEVAQKLPLWLKVTVRDKGGHGALPPDGGGAVMRLLSVLQSIESIERPYRLTPEVARHFRILSGAKRGEQRDVLLEPMRYVSSEELHDKVRPSVRALLRDTIAVTQFRAGNSVNSIPSTAWATLDIRLLPGEDSASFLERLSTAVAGRAEIEVLLEGKPADPSPVDTDLYRLLERLMKEREPDSIVGPIVTVGTTDSRFLRQKGIVAYGMTPFKLNYYDGDSIHGIDERIRVRFFIEGVDLMREIVSSFCAKPR